MSPRDRNRRPRGAAPGTATAPSAPDAAARAGRRPYAAWLARPAIVLPLAVLVGLALRLAPCVREPGFDFVMDAGCYERLTRVALAHGHLPALDPLADPPLGRATAAHLPTGLFTLGAATHRTLGALGVRDLRWSLALLVALGGALVALPVWLGARAAGASRRVAALAALASVFLPAHLARTFAYFYRFDGVGTLLVTTHLATALAALAAKSARPRVGWALASALALLGAAWVWRVSLLVPAIELAFAALWLAARGSHPGLRDLWLAIVLVFSPGTLAIGYLRGHGFLTSPTWLAAIGIAVLLALPFLGPRSRVGARLAALGVVAALAAIGGRAAGAADYSGVSGMLLARLGLGAGAHDPTAALMLSVRELRGMTVTELLLDPRLLFLLGTWLVAAPWLAWALAGRDGARRALSGPPAPLLLGFATAGLLALSFLFERASVMLAPLAAMALALLAETLATPAPPRARPAARAARAALRVALALCALATAGAGGYRAAVAWSRYGPNSRAIHEYLRAHVAPGTVVACDWDAGYELQQGAGVATVTDGLLEDPVNRGRIVEFDRAMMAREPDSLESFCARHGARWLVTPPGDAIHSMAVVADDPLARTLERGEPVPPEQMERVAVHLIGNDRELPAFRRVFAAGGYQVYEVVGARAAP